MSEQEKQSFTLEEQSSIIEILLKYMNTIPDLPAEIKLDTLEESGLSMCLNTSAGGGKGQFNVIGGYSAEFPFMLYLKMNATDTRKKIDAIKTLTQIGKQFDEDSNSGNLPKLQGRDTCSKIEMVSLPYLYGTDETNHNLYQATCVLTYRHKSIYE